MIPNAYLLDTIRKLDKQSRRTYLDFGCGDGSLVMAAREHDIQMFGAEVFLGGTEHRRRAEERGLIGHPLHEIIDGSTGFRDETFDVVVSNQVLEHVEDLDQVLGEISRVLKPGGLFLALFPDKRVLREGHCGVPLLHWFPKGSSFRVHYASLVRSLGFGYHSEGKEPRMWAQDFCNWLDQFTYYRSRREIRRAYSQHFTDFRYVERDFIRFRLRYHRALAPFAFLASIPGLAELGEELFRRLGHLVISARKPS